LSGTSKQTEISVRTPIDVDEEAVLFAIYVTYSLAYVLFASFLLEHIHVSNKTGNVRET